MQQTACCLWRVSADAFLVRLDAPAGCLRDDEAPVFELRYRSEQFLIPRGERSAPPAGAAGGREWPPRWDPCPIRAGRE